MIGGNVREENRTNYIMIKIVELFSRKVHDSMGNWTVRRTYPDRSRLMSTMKDRRRKKLSSKFEPVQG